MVSHKPRRGSAALIIGLLVFILAMMITFSDVYGLSRFDYPSPGNNPGDNSDIDLDKKSTIWQENVVLSQGDYYDPDVPINTGVPAVPEPTTLTLLAIGCGALLLRNRKPTP
jgi:hypothetical protein